MPRFPKVISEPVTSAVQNERTAELRALDTAINAFYADQSAAGALSSGNTLAGVARLCADVIDSLAKYIVDRVDDFARANPRDASKVSVEGFQRFAVAMLLPVEAILSARVSDTVARFGGGKDSPANAPLFSTLTARRTEAVARMDLALDLLVAELRRDHHVPRWRVVAEWILNITEGAILIGAVCFAYRLPPGSAGIPSTTAAAAAVAFLEFTRRVILPGRP